MEKVELVQKWWSMHLTPSAAFNGTKGHLIGHVGVRCMVNVEWCAQIFALNPIFIQALSEMMIS